MSEPIDIKTKKIILQPITKRFDKAVVYEALQKDIITHWDTWSKFQQVWANKAYKTFKDFDKYIVLIYLIRNYWQQSSNKFEFYSYEEFYKKDKLVIDKINLIKISTELKIPKETIRRKVNELQKEGVLSREGKTIIMNKSAYGFQKPQASLDALSIFLEKKSNVLQGQEWFGTKVGKDDAEIYIKKYFTIIWLRFLTLQIPFLLRHRSIFGDLETWMIWGNIAVHHQKNLAKSRDQIITTEKSQTDINYANYYLKVSSAKVLRGVNASSIAEITSIPRATVIRKLKWLVKQDALKRNKNLEYIMKNTGKLNKKIEKNFRDNQIFVAEFLVDFFDYYKNSNFKP